MGNFGVEMLSSYSRISTATEILRFEVRQLTVSRSRIFTLRYQGFGITGREMLRKLGNVSKLYYCIKSSAERY